MTCPPLPVFRGKPALEAHAAGRHDLARTAPVAHASLIAHERHALTRWRRARLNPSPHA